MEKTYSVSKKPIYIPLLTGGLLLLGLYLKDSTKNTRESDISYKADINRL